MRESLGQLAELAGIEPSFRDYFGNEVVVSDETKRALLAAMGHDVASDAAIEDEVRAAHERLWSCVLEPVAVCGLAKPPRILCALPAEPADRNLEWEIALEDGHLLCAVTSWKDAEWVDARVVNEQTIERRRIVIDARLPLGYHRLTIRGRGVHATCALIVVPDACYVPDAPKRFWVLATQLYALRSASDWGIGDFGSLRALVTLASAAGGWAVALNPLHELHPGKPTHVSPYAPSSRLFLNTLYLDVTAAPEMAESPQTGDWIRRPEFAKTLRSLRAQEFVDYHAVAALKRGALELLFATFCVNRLERPGDSRAAAFRRFARERGPALERLALYEAIDEYFRAGDESRYGWLQWPPEYRDPENSAVRIFAREHRPRIEFFTYLQWLADEQLGEAAGVAAQRDCGLYRDLAVGVDPNGADAWSDQRTIVAAASLGAPADPLNEGGQRWGLAPFSAHELRALAYAPFVELLRANMRHARILRIDHVMALRRAFWIPAGSPAAEGAYVRYDFDEMLGVVALESVRAGCVVVGEDLGTVPEGFRERLRAAGVLSSRLLYFERAWDGAFLPARDYPRLAAASIGTHDLPPLAGWWIGNDVFTPAAQAQRRDARFALVDALEREGSVDPAGARRLREDAAAGGTLQVADELSQAVHRFLAVTPSLLAVVAIEDVFGETGAVNVPGTVDEHPNWRRRRRLPLEAFENDGRLLRIGAIMCDTAKVTSEREQR